jgi:hypothetical protein
MNLSTVPRFVATCALKHPTIWGPMGVGAVAWCAVLVYATLPVVVSAQSLCPESEYRESTESWAAPLRDLKARGLRAPRLLIADGHLGIWGGPCAPSSRR